MRLGPPSSVRVRAPGLRLLTLIGSLKVTSTLETAALRGLGETPVIEVKLSGEMICTVVWAPVGVGWTLPALSVATL
jgi:hypothetical protein